MAMIYRIYGVLTVTEISKNKLSPLPDRRRLEGKKIMNKSDTFILILACPVVKGGYSMTEATCFVSTAGIAKSNPILKTG